MSHRSLRPLHLDPLENGRVYTWGANEYRQLGNLSIDRTLCQDSDSWYRGEVPNLLPGPLVDDTKTNCLSVEAIAAGA